MRHRTPAPYALDPITTVLSDLMFQVVVYLLLTAAAGGIGTAKVDGDPDLPPGGKAAACPTGTFHATVTVDAQRHLFVGDKQTDADALLDALKEACKDTPAPRVLVRCDGRIDVETLFKLNAVLRDDLNAKVEYAVKKGGPR
jgi:biopolymer transport protein ExbD